MKVDFIKNKHYIKDDEKYGKKEMKCFETTEQYAFLAPVVGEGTIDLTQVEVYSNITGDTPIETLLSYKED